MKDKSQISHSENEDSQETIPSISRRNFVATTTFFGVALAGGVPLQSVLTGQKTALAAETKADEAMRAHNVIASRQTAISPGAVHNIGGFVGERMAANRENYLEKFGIDKYVSMVEAEKTRDWWWIGEQPGKWLEAATWSAKSSGDTVLATKMRAMLARMEVAQRPDGYLGITDPAVRTAQQPLRGMDPYELYFTMHALITASQQLNDPKALQAAKKLGDYFVKTIGPGKAEFWPSDLRPPENIRKHLSGAHSQIAGHTAHYGWEGTLLVDPMLRLYQATGDKRYLDWGQWVVANIDKWSGWDSFSRLDDVAGGKIGINELQPYVHSHTFQMNFLGFLRLYQITGDPSLLRKVRGAWDDIATRQMYITGGVSVGEHYEKGVFKPATGNVVETCATMSWMQLTEALLELTGDPKYTDAIETLLVNHVFAAQTEDGTSCRYHTPPNGSKPLGYFHGPDCCTSSGPRLISMLPQFFYSQNGEHLFVNQFVASTANFTLPGGNPVQLTQQTRFPETENVVINVNPQKAAKFPISVRIPQWCAAPQLKINGVTQPVKAGYAQIERVWKSGDQVELSLPMNVKWQQSDGGENPGEPVAARPYALMRGPVVYALDTVWWENSDVKVPADVGKGVGLKIEKPNYKQVAAPADTMGPALEVPVTTLDGQQTTAKMLPFANVGTWRRPGAATPDRNSAAYSYAVWLQDVDGPTFEANKREAAQKRQTLENALDYVVIGDQQSEQAHNQSASGNSGLANGNAYRDGKTFGYDLKISPDAPSVLVATFWGGDVGRTFDILANDRVIGTQKLDNPHPGQFFEARFPIPFELISGQTDALGQKLDKVTIKFVGVNGSVAGGLFGLRTELAQGEGH